MKKLSSLILILLISIVGCGVGEQKVKRTTMSSALLNEIRGHVAEVRTWAPLCDGYPTKGECDDGDAVLFAGLLCTAGEAKGCEMVKNSVGPDGRLWRSPMRVGFEEDDTSSRDMLIGFLHYLVKTRDRDTALRFDAYLKANDRKLCPTSTDSRCEITSVMWGLMGRVWKKLGITRNGLMQDGQLVDIVAINVSASTVPKGYQAHLVAAQVLLLRELGYNDGWVRGSAGILEKKDPYNPLFRLLARGGDERVGHIILEQLTASVPAKNNQWSLERDTAERAWESSMGWERAVMLGLRGGGG